MALLTFHGAEVYVGPVTAGADGTSSGTATITRDTAVFRSGLASYKFDSAAGNLTGQVVTVGQISATSPVYQSIWVRLPANVGTAAIIFCSDTGALTPPSVRLNTDGTISLMVNSVAQGAASVQALDTTWRQIILKVTYSGSNYTAAELTLSGVVVGTSWTGTLFGFPVQTRFGWLQVPGASKVINFDDYVKSDETGATNNTYPGAEKAIYMPPLSDTQIGTWTGGAGGVTNLFEALNNKPPIGTATETNLTQIESIDGSGDNATDEYRGNCGSYITAGIAAADTVLGITVVCDTGEDVATGTKTGSVGFQANPAIAYEVFFYGGDVGALGTWPSNWADRMHSFTNTPTVTLSSDLVLGLRKIDSGTRVASVDALGAYVLYRPATGGALLPGPSPLQTPATLYRM